MKTFVLLALLFVAAGQALQCEPGKMFYDQCNRCKCTNDGTSAICTKIGCPPGRYDENGKLISLESGEDKLGPKVCEPGKTFKNDCNTCVCSADGRTAACTLMACIPNSQPEEGMVCQPGSRFKNDCNSCVCSEDGKRSMCTEMACPSWTKLRKARRGV